MTFKSFIKKAMLISTLGCSLIIAIDQWVSLSTSNQIYTDINKIPKKNVALVLGTSKYIGKSTNPFYTYRINTAIKLYQANKVNKFLLSGDNAYRSYNEPWTMKRDLMKAGIPANKIYLDYAGFRTLDSIIRAKEIFATNNFIIVTQKFHCERALFIAKNKDVKAVCIAVPSPQGIAGIKIRAREIFARVKALLDIYITDQNPKFLGPKEPITNAKNKS